jgi:hypothetical protein
MGRRILFTNVKYLVGGGQTGIPSRMRRGQNIHLYLDDSFDDIELKHLPELLHIAYNGRFICTKSTRVKVKNRKP